MTGSGPREVEGGQAGKGELCKITSYLHSAGFELLVKQRAVGALPPFTKCRTKVRPSTRHVFATLSTCRAVGWGRVALWVYAAELVEGSQRVGLERGAASVAADQTSVSLMA